MLAEREVLLVGALPGRAIFPCVADDCDCRTALSNILHGLLSELVSGLCSTIRNAVMPTFDNVNTALRPNSPSDEELSFKATARRGKLTSNWVAGQLRLAGDGDFGTA